MTLLPQPYGVCTSWLGLCVGACSGYKMGSDRSLSPLFLEDLSMLNSGTFLCSRNAHVR